MTMGSNKTFQISPFAAFAALRETVSRQGAKNAKKFLPIQTKNYHLAE
jgi:hypothetical protein